MFNLRKYSQVQNIPYNEVMERQMFGPVFHGSTQEKLQSIKEHGFKQYIGYGKSGDISNGYSRLNYWNSIPPPIHHLGYGIYFTTSKTIGKKFNYGTTKGLIPYYLDVPRLEEINFGAPRTMMQWWISNGYNADLAKESEEGRVQATIELTNNLKANYDAVWFKGKGIYKLLDEDQICVYDTSRIYIADKQIINSGEIGSKVRRKSDGIKGIIESKMPIEEARRIVEDINPEHYIKNFLDEPNVQNLLRIKWTPGGRDVNYIPDTLIDYL